MDRLKINVNVTVQQLPPPVFRIGPYTQPKIPEYGWYLPDKDFIQKRMEYYGNLAER